MNLPRDYLSEHVDTFKNKYDELAGIPPGLEFPPEPEMGDFAVALPMRAADPLGKSPREIGRELANHLREQCPGLDELSVAGPGFVNCRFKDEWLIDSMRKLLDRSGLPYPEIGEGERVLLEFVSANPTGPLHVGHGRGAIYGDVLARLFTCHGYEVTREYYVNDVGGQIERLGESIKLRAREREGEEISLGEDHYKGDYLVDLVKEEGMSPDTPASQLAEVGQERILESIFQVLEDCGVEFDSTVHESEVATEEALQNLLETLRNNDLTYQQDGALFLRTTQGGDDKDRVLIRENGQATYFANDLLYHSDKFERDFNRYLNIWGHDHHGYQQRLISGLEFLDHPVEKLEIELYQLVDLYRGGDPVSMSKRGGEYVLLSELLEEVGVDALRFNFLTTNHNSPLDFDIEVATSETEDNPVYYVQYAHTRMASVLDKVTDDLRRVDWERSLTPEGHQLLLRALDFPQTSLEALQNREPHVLTYTLQDLASRFHTYYNKHRILDPEYPERSGLRIGLVRFLKQVFREGLNLLGVSSPESM